MQVLTADVAVVGSGAGGGTVAGELWRAGLDVIVLEAGKDRFAGSVVHSRNLHPSVAEDPLAGADIDREWVFPCGAVEPLQGFPGYRVSHGLGGMTALWTGNCPTPLESEIHGSWTRRDLTSYLDRARKLLSVSTEVNGSSRRGGRILEAVAAKFKREIHERPIQHMPVAVRWQDGRAYFTSSGDLLLNAEGRRPPLRVEAVCQALTSRAGRIESVECLTGEGTMLRVSASIFVVATGGVSIPQIIHNSRLDVGPAIGRYMTDHMIVTTQLCLPQHILADALDDDPMFSVWMPASNRRPWQSEVFRHPQEPAPGRVPSAMADVCSFSRVQPRPESRVLFDDDRTDDFGLPRPVVEFSLTAADLDEFRLLHDENIELSRLLVVPEDGTRSVTGSLGAAGHLMGTCRSGECDDGTSVTDLDGKFWRLDNLYAAGLPVLGAATACNPTLTCVAYGLRTADAIMNRGSLQ